MGGEIKIEDIEILGFHGDDVFLGFVTVYIYIFTRMFTASEPRTTSK
jgi:hypothetical protein